MLCCYAYSRQSCVDDLWIVIPMFRTWEQWAMVDWSTAFHGQKMRWTPTGFDTYLFSNINYAPGTLRPHMCCARVFFPPLLQESSKQIRSNQSIRPEQFSINWDRPKLPLHIQKYPGISRNKEYANPHVSKNMQKHVSDNASPKPRTELWKSPSTQHHASATNLLATPQSHARNHPKIPCISYHTLAQHSTGASSFLIMTKAEFWAQLPWGGNGY